jgi:hypothetical protein
MVTNPRIVIDYPVAIEFFTRANFVFKYERDNFDTLSILLKMKPSNVLYEKYNLTEQYNYYAQGIRPVLLKGSVVILDNLVRDQTINLKNKDNAYLIDLRSFAQTDGVLMYTPGKKPIFWTMKKDEENCFGYFGLPKWYYNCL